MKKAERLNQELIFLKDKQKFTLKELMKEFQISRRTALRDVEGLEELGLPFYAEVGKYGGYQIISQNFVTPVYFNTKEIQAIFFALNAQKLLSSTPFEQSYERIREKLIATLPGSQQETINQLLKVVRFYGIAPVKSVDSLALISQSILEEKVIRVNYTQYEIRDILLQISELFYREGVWVCSGLDMETRRWGTYQCDYMETVELVEEFEPTYTLQDLLAFQESYEKNYHDIPFRCKLTPFGKELFLKHNYPNMQLEKQGDQFYIIGGYNEEELGYMTHYLISFGEHVIVEYPKQLKKSFVASLEEMIKRNN